MATRKTKTTSEQAAALLAQLQFVEQAQKDAHGQAAQRFAMFDKGVLMATDNFSYTASIPTPFTELYCAVNVALLKTALGACTEPVELTQSSVEYLELKSGKVRADIPCIAPKDLLVSAPDVGIAPNDYTPLLEGFAMLAPICEAKSERAAFETILVNGNTMTATNGHVLAEFWHGLDFPPGVVLPRSALKLLKATKKKPVNFGWNPGTSITFWFDDGSWFKTQLYKAEWPGISHLFDGAPPSGSLPPLPEEFAKALRLAAPFAKARHRGVDFLPEGVSVMNKKGFFYEVDGPQRGTYNPDTWLDLLPFITKAHFISEKDMNKAYVYGERFRGVIMGLRGD